MMKLRLDDLAVESFVTHLSAPGSGTVHAHETQFPCDTKDTQLDWTCNNSGCGSECNHGCTGANCYPSDYRCTGDMNTCPYCQYTQEPGAPGSCYFTCVRPVE